MDFSAQEIQTLLRERLFLYQKQLEVAQVERNTYLMQTDATERDRIQEELTDRQIITYQDRMNLLEELLAIIT